MNDETASISRRMALSRAARMLATIAIAVVAERHALAATPAKPGAPKKKIKAAKEDFFFQEEPGENGKRCENCVNFEPTTGDKGTCALIEGEVCKRCYCQGWTDKNGGKKAGA
jgi:hypothetical protein